MTDYYSSHSSKHSSHRRSSGASRSDWYTIITPSDTSTSDSYSSSSRRKSLDSGRLSRRNSMSSRNSLSRSRRNSFSHSDDTYIHGSVFTIKLGHEKQALYYGENSEITKVTKTVRSSQMDDGFDHIGLAIERAETTSDVITSFCDEIETHDYSINVVIPKIAKVRKTVRLSRRRSASSRLQMLDFNSQNRQYKDTMTVTGLTEPYIPNLKSYDMTSGWTHNDEGVAETLLRILPYYSYYWSGRKFVLASFQASIDRKHKLITIVAPDIISKNEMQYGIEDSGSKGIRSLFSMKPTSPSFRWSGERRRYWHQFHARRASDNSVKMEVRNYRAAC